MNQSVYQQQMQGMVERYDFQKVEADEMNHTSEQYLPIQQHTLCSIIQHGRSSYISARMKG